MYDMYPWDSASQGDYPPDPLRSWRNPSREPRQAREPREVREPRQVRQPRTDSRGISPAQAVQVALDRRDNGGEAAREALPAATAPAAVTAPAAGQGRQ